ncbi:MAG: FadR family transcriptional regulator [Bryobacterales bacterium]|nr:FadR family transcriptional regulator [Bryobacterales bacterium]
MLENLKPVSRVSVSDEIVDQMAGLISAGALKPGDRVPSEKQLCVQFGVGRTSVREALRSLSVMGILKTQRGEGTFVSAERSRYVEKAMQWDVLLDGKAAGHLIETRLMLECETASFAAERASEEDLAAIAAAIADVQNAFSGPALVEPGRYLEADLRFHLAIARATRNPILVSLLGTIRGSMQAWIAKTVPARAAKSIKDHRKILAGLRARNREKARAAMSAHIRSSSSDLRRRLKQT